MVAPKLKTGSRPLPAQWGWFLDKLMDNKDATQRTVVPATKCSCNRDCLVLLNQLFLMRTSITQIMHYLGQPLILMNNMP